MSPAEPRTLDRTSRAWSLAAAGTCLLPLLLQLPPQIALGIALAAVSTTLLSLRRPIPGALRLLLAVTVIGATFAATGFGLGRDTACALLAAMLAIKPAETWRLRDARSLIGFALFGESLTLLKLASVAAILLGVIGLKLAAP